jgi:hypothetical protein
LQIESIDDDLRNALWNVMDRFMWSRLSYAATNSVDRDERLKLLCVSLGRLLEGSSRHSPHAVGARVQAA